MWVYLPPPSPGSAIYVLYWHADFHTVNGRQGGGGGDSVNTAVIGGLAALLMVAIVVLVITGLLWCRSVCVYIHDNHTLKEIYRHAGREEKKTNTDNLQQPQRLRKILSLSCLGKYAHSQPEQLRKIYTHSLSFSSLDSASIASKCTCTCT